MPPESRLAHLLAHISPHRFPDTLISHPRSGESALPCRTSASTAENGTSGTVDTSRDRSASIIVVGGCVMDVQAVAGDPSTLQACPCSCMSQLLCISPQPSRGRNSSYLLILPVFTRSLEQVPRVSCGLAQASVHAYRRVIRTEQLSSCPEADRGSFLTCRRCRSQHRRGSGAPPQGYGSLDGSPRASSRCHHQVSGSFKGMVLQGHGIIPKASCPPCFKRLRIQEVTHRG